MNDGKRESARSPPSASAGAEPEARPQRLHPEPAIDSGTAEQAQRLLNACCGSRTWLENMIRRRPFGSLDGLLEASDRAFDALVDEEDWLEAFAAHPRIGDRPPSTEPAPALPMADVATPASESSPEPGLRLDHSFAAQEQASTASAPEQILAALAAGNRLYELRFGFVFLVFATGKSPEQMLDILRRRLESTRERELRRASGEQRLITRLRLRQLWSENAQENRQSRAHRESAPPDS